MTKKAKTDAESASQTEVPVTRRGLMKSTAGAAAVVGLGATTSAEAGRRGLRGYTPVNHSSGHPVLGGHRNRRNADAVIKRVHAARDHLGDFIRKQRTNGDEGAYSDYRASFAKTLPHNNLGEVDRFAYRKLLRALDTGKDRHFDAIPLAPTADRKLANPQGAHKFDMVGRDSHSTWMRPAPVFNGAETSAEMGELYWKALCRDVPFSDFEFDAKITSAVSDLNAFSQPVGPKTGGKITSQTIFRGETPGDLTGPYISQFLFKPIPFGPLTVDQKYASPSAGVNYMTSHGEWLAVQRGEAPIQSLIKNGSPKYICDARSLGEYVHTDFTYQAYMNAALILLGTPGSFDAGNYYNSASTEGGFVSLGGPDVLDLVTKAANLALTGAWYQKWLVHRRLRPEVYGGRLHHQLTGAKDYQLSDEIGYSEGVNRTYRKYGTFFLPMAYTEGSPTHPSYPAGHATIAGACCTVLKAFFEESFEIPDPVVADTYGAQLLPYGGTLTVGGEINKLANNIALGRDWAGVHYRSDGVDGLSVGEQQAIGLLQDYSRTYSERFGGFVLTKFNGRRIRIKNGNIRRV